MIKAAGFVCGAQAEQPAYNSSPITKGALFTAMKPAEGQPQEKLTEEEKTLVDAGGCGVGEKTGMPPGYMTYMAKAITGLVLLIILTMILKLLALMASLFF
ncbi:MAG: hypothetical protein OEZ55_13190 [Nitrospinota bacterium]|nr:hypothetical protein [Nitrospinota bacterium]